MKCGLRGEKGGTLSKAPPSSKTPRAMRVRRFNYLVEFMCHSDGSEGRSQSVPAVAVLERPHLWIRDDRAGAIRAENTPIVELSPSGSYAFPTRGVIAGILREAGREPLTVLTVRANVPSWNADSGNTSDVRHAADARSFWICTVSYWMHGRPLRGSAAIAMPCGMAEGPDRGGREQPPRPGPQKIVYRKRPYKDLSFLSLSSVKPGIEFSWWNRFRSELPRANVIHRDIQDNQAVRPIASVQGWRW